MVMHAALLSLLFGTTVAAPPSQVYRLQGAGTTNPQNLIRNVMDVMTNEARIPLHLGYRAVGSSTGYKEFTGYQCKSGACTGEGKPFNDFGAGDIPIPADYYNAAKTAGRSIMQVPLFLGAIGIFYNDAKGKIPDVNLSPCTLAKIFSGQIQNWNHPDIKPVDSSKTMPNIPITVVHRVLGSSSTAGTTQYFDVSTADENCPEAWDIEGKRFGSTVKWETTKLLENNRRPSQGSSGVLNAIRTTEGAIGYMDAGQGYDQVGMKEIHLKNKNGRYLTSRNAVLDNAGLYALDNKIFPDDYTSDWSQVNLLNLGGNKDDIKQNTFWPITMVTYLYLEKNQSNMDPYAHGLLDYFAKFVATSPKGQQKEFLKDQFGFNPMPQKVLDKNLEQLNLIIKPANAVTFKSETDGGQPGELTGDKSTADTQIWEGADDLVISGKRKTYSLTQREQTNNELQNLFSESNSPTGSALGKSLADLIASINSLKTSVEKLEQKVTTLENAKDTESEVNVGSVHAPTVDFQTAFTLLCGLSTLWMAMHRN